MESVALALPAASDAELRAVAEGALFGAYAFTTYRKKSAKAHKPPVKAITVATPLAK